MLDSLAMAIASVVLGLVWFKLGHDRAELKRARQEHEQHVRKQRELDTQLQVLFTESPVAVMIHDFDTGEILDANPAAYRSYGLDSVEALTRANIWDAAPPYDEATARRYLALAARKGRHQFDWRTRLDDGTEFWEHVTLTHVKLEGVDRIMATAVDITARKRAELDLRRAAQVFQNSHDGVMITDPDNRIVDVNPAFTRITGYGRQESLGQDPGMLASGHHESGFFDAMWQQLRETDHWQGEIWNRRKDGELYAQRLSISAVRNTNGEVENHVGVFSDITHVKAYEAELERIANYDPLTGLPNRRLLGDRLTHAIAHAHRSGTLLAVCYLDLDEFKPINDRLGHSAGDEVLMQLGHRLRKLVREDDTVARLGGDEFVLLLGELSTAQVVAPIIERVLGEVRTPFTIPDTTVQVSVSVGISLYPADGDNPDLLLRHADQAMYGAKTQGRNQYQWFSRPPPHTARRQSASRGRHQGDPQSS